MVEYNANFPIRGLITMSRVRVITGPLLSPDPESESGVTGDVKTLSLSRGETLPLTAPHCPLTNETRKAVMTNKSDEN